MVVLIVSHDEKCGGKFERLSKYPTSANAGEIKFLPLRKFSEMLPMDWSPSQTPRYKAFVSNHHHCQKRIIISVQRSWSWWWWWWYVSLLSLCAKMTSWFNYWGHMCLIFELLGDYDDDRLVGNWNDDNFDVEDTADDVDDNYLNIFVLQGFPSLTSWRRIITILTHWNRLLDFVLKSNRKSIKN